MGLASLRRGRPQSLRETTASLAPLLHLEDFRGWALLLFVVTLPAVVGEPTSGPEAQEIREDEELSTAAVLAFYSISVVGTAVIARSAAIACCACAASALHLLMPFLRTGPCESALVSPPPAVVKTAKESYEMQGIAAASPGAPLFYGSDLSGADARNLIVALCRMHNCGDNFVSVLLTLLGGVILPSRNTLHGSKGLPSVSIDGDAKEFFADCEGKLHLKKRKCLRGRRVALLQEQGQILQDGEEDTKY